MWRPHLYDVVVVGEVHVGLGLVQDRVLAAVARGESGAGSCERRCTQDGNEFGARHLQGKGKGKCKGNGKSKDPSHREMHVGTR